MYGGKQRADADVRGEATDGNADDKRGKPDKSTMAADLLLLWSGQGWNKM